MPVNKTRALAARADSQVDPATLMKMVANRRKKTLRDAIVFMEKLPAKTRMNRDTIGIGEFPLAASRMTGDVRTKGPP
jgi:hypothetical protein